MATGPPPGTPEYDSWAAEDKGPVILAVCWAATAASTTFILARLFVRGRIQRQLRSDDYIVLISAICGWLASSLSTAAVYHGGGKHWATLQTSQQESVSLFATAAFGPGIISFAMPKLAVIVLLTRLLNPGRIHKWFLWCMGIICVLTLFATVGMLLTQCMPAKALWDFSIKNKTCYPKHYVINYSIYACVMSAFADLYLSIYPCVVLWKLQLPWQKKTALSVALGMGWVSGVIAVYKSTRLHTLSSPDFSYDTLDLCIWTILEGSAIMIASSIPLLQQFFEFITGHSFIRSRRSRSSKSTLQCGNHSDATGGAQVPGGTPKRDNENMVTEFEMTVQNPRRDPEVDSQDSIVPLSQAPTHIGSDTSRESERPYGGGQPAPASIIRTNEVTVTSQPRRDRGHSRGENTWSRDLEGQSIGDFSTTSDFGWDEIHRQAHGMR